MTERLHFHFSLSCIGEGNGDPLQCSCLENPRDRGAWWAAVYGAAQSRTRLKWLSSSSSGLHYSSTSVGWLCCTGSGLGGWGSGPKLGSQTHWTWLETLRAVFPNSPLVSATCCVPSLFLWPSWRAPPVWDAMWHLFNAAPAADTQPGVLMILPGVLSPRDPQTTNLGGGGQGGLVSSGVPGGPGLQEETASSHTTHPLTCTATATPVSFCSLKLVGTHQPVSPARETEHNPMDPAPCPQPASHLWKT